MNTLNTSYPIKIENVDFVAENSPYSKGSRAKKLVRTFEDDQLALFKYETQNDQKYRGSEDCSEKISSEIAKILGYPAADIDFAEGENGERGILSYLFIDPTIDLKHASDFMENVNKNQESVSYTIENIRQSLKDVFHTDSLFPDFIKILILDILVDERDRHGENWGVIRAESGPAVAPIYDTAACLLRDLRNEKFLNNKFSSWDDPVGRYIDRSEVNIYKEDSTEKYQSFELLEYLLINYPEYTQKEVAKLKLLTNSSLECIIKKIPNKRMTQKHKDYLLEFIVRRRDIMIQKGVEYERGR